MNSKQETLWIISELFPPEETSTGYIMGEIANAMIQKYEVKVICGPDYYNEKKKYLCGSSLAIDNRIEVTRVAAIKENKQSKLSRIRKFMLMSWLLYDVARKKIKNGDHVLMVTNPFPLIVLMAHLRKKRDISLSMLVHDVFPEGLYTDMHVPFVAYKLLERVFNRSYARVDKLLSLGRDMNEVLKKKCSGRKNQPEIVIIENWGDISGITPRDRVTDGFIKVQYAGNIGNAQGVQVFVNRLKEANNPTVHLSIWGTGSAEEAIRKRVNEYGMNEIVQFNGPYSRNQQIDVLNDSDISLVTLVKGMYGLGVPSKTYNILAAGKPVLYIGEKNTEIWRTVEENQIGFCFAPDDKQGIVDFLHSLNSFDIFKLKEMGHKARILAEKKYSKSVILNKFLEEI